MSLAVELKVSNFSRSLRFYTDVLGFTTLRFNAQAREAEVERDDTTIFITEVAEAIGALEYPYGRGVKLIVWVRDIEAVVAGIEAFGARLYLPPTIREHVEDGLTHSHIAAEVCDPDGFCLRFCQSMSPGRNFLTYE